MNHYEEYQKLNDQLLGLIMSGKCESKKADTVRDQMDEHWHKMSSIEQDLMRKYNEKQID